MIEEDPPALHGRVVVGYDGSAPAERALDQAAAEAARRGADLEVVMADPWAPPPVTGLAAPPPGSYHSPNPAAHQQVEAAAERAREAGPGLNVLATLSGEAPWRAVLRTGAGATLTVVGTRGHGGFAGLVLGSVSLRVAAHCESPLLVVRGDTDLAAPRGEVLVGLQGDEGDDDAVRFGYAEAARRAARLRLLHAWMAPAPLGGMPAADAVRAKEQAEEGRRAAEAVPRAAAARWRESYPDVPVAADEECGPTAGVLVEASRDADVLVLTAHRNPRRLGMQLGPVTHAVLHHAHCPVALIPAKRA
ncbi:universal stress protein [Streptomyces sp. A7024]|uniref:Universal stress protein n=1 Tax=Streptomyces coryli TaxID=1128680 RepID=A0A6G4UD41_9ACTN|nr:universal stress protein [Streptomyces coryli]NGN69298.1 universal stress protein [Streptomyces coryli]